MTTLITAAKETTSEGSRNKIIFQPSMLITTTLCVENSLGVKVNVICLVMAKH